MCEAAEIRGIKCNPEAGGQVQPTSWREGLDLTLMTMLPKTWAVLEVNMNELFFTKDTLVRTDQYNRVLLPLRRWNINSNNMGRVLKFSWTSTSTSKPSCCLFSFVFEIWTRQKSTETSVINSFTVIKLPESLQGVRLLMSCDIVEPLHPQTWAVGMRPTQAALHSAKTVTGE